jgi:hypothetical protein
MYPELNVWFQYQLQALYNEQLLNLNHLPNQLHLSAYFHFHRRHRRRLD